MNEVGLLFVLPSVSFFMFVYLSVPLFLSASVCFSVFHSFDLYTADIKSGQQFQDKNFNRTFFFGLFSIKQIEI